LVFSSLIFLFGFLPILLAVYFAAPRSWRNTILLVASLLFYAWGEFGYVALMLVSAAVNYGFGLWVDSARGRPSATWIVAAAVAANLSLLG
jgi:alginate O-acetyltransferase complex protein AlgI